MKNLWIVGYRDFGFDVAEAAVQGEFSVEGFIDYDPDEKRQDLDQYKVVLIEELTPSFDREFVCAMTSTLLRESLVQRIAELTQGKLRPAKLVHRRTIISPSACIGQGTIVMANAVMAAGTGIGKFGLVNRGATVGHHTILSDFCTVGPGVNVGGNCYLGNNTYVGIGATILNKIRIGSHCLIAAGAVVTKDIPDHTVVMGVPAHVTQTDYPGR